MTLKLHVPDADPEPAAPPSPVGPPPPVARKPPAKAARQACRRCGKTARWPRDSRKPVFCTRLCGYLMALDLVKRSDPKGPR